MSAETWIECSFLIPLRRDALLSDGRRHPVRVWKWLDRVLFVEFGGRTVAPGDYQGFYTDPDTGEQVADLSRKFIVAVPSSRIDELRRLLQEACLRFGQKCIYFSVAGQVEFVEAKNETH